MDALSASVSSLKGSPAAFHSAPRELHRLKTNPTTTTPHLPLHLSTTRPPHITSSNSIYIKASSSTLSPIRTLSSPSHAQPHSTVHRNPASGYAAALLDIARCNSSLEAVHKDVLRLLRVLQIQGLLRNPFVGGADKGKVIKQATKRGKFDRLLVGLVKMLVEKNKAWIVSEVLVEFQRIYEELKGTRVVLLSSNKSDRGGG